MSSEHFQTIPGSTPSTFGALNTRVQRSEQDMDLVINGNKCDSNVTKGQYVSVRNSTISGITDGIYQAEANVAANTAFTSANLTAVTAGGLNELSSRIESLSDQIGSNDVVFKRTATGYNAQRITVRQINSSTGNNEVIITSNEEGGNIRLNKGNDTAHLEFDTQPMNGSSGYARLYLGKLGTEVSKTFKWKESGSFEDGLGNDTATMASHLVYTVDTPYITFNSLTWTASASGAYYASVDLTSYVPSDGKLISINVLEFSSIKSTDNVRPYLDENNGRKAHLLSNVNTFASNQTGYKFRLVYMKV